MQQHDVSSCLKISEPIHKLECRYTHTHTHNLVISDAYVAFPFCEGKYAKSKCMRIP